MATSRSESAVVLKLSKISSYLTSFQVDNLTPSTFSRPSQLQLLAEVVGSSNGDCRTAPCLRSSENEHESSSTTAGSAGVPLEGPSAAHSPPISTVCQNRVSTYYDSTRECFTDESFKSLGKRLKTYGDHRWHMQSEVLSAYTCARRGWYMVGTAMLRCSDCQQLLSLMLPRPADIESYERALKLLQDRVHSKHLKTCRWRSSPSLLSWCRPPSLLEPAAMYALVQLAHDLAASAMSSERLYLVDEGHLLMRQLGVQESTVEGVLGAGHTAPQRIALLLLLCGWKCTNIPAVLRCELCKRRIGMWYFRSVEEQERISRSLDENVCNIAVSKGTTDMDVAIVMDGSATNSTHDGTPVPMEEGAPSTTTDSVPNVINNDDTQSADDSSLVLPDCGSSSPSDPSSAANIGDPSDHHPSNTEDSNVTSESDSILLCTPNAADPIAVQSSSESKDENSLSEDIAKTGALKSKMESTIEVEIESTSAEGNSGAAVGSTNSNTVSASINSDEDAASCPSKNIAAAVDDDSKGGSISNMAVDVLNTNDSSKMAAESSVTPEDSRTEYYGKNGSKHCIGEEKSISTSVSCQCNRAVQESGSAEGSAMQDGTGNSVAVSEKTEELASKDNHSKSKRQDLEDESDAESEDQNKNQCDSKKVKVSADDCLSTSDQLQGANSEPTSTIDTPPPRPILCPLTQHHTWCGWVTPAEQFTLPSDSVVSPEEQGMVGYEVLSSQLKGTIQRAAAKRWTQQPNYSTCVKGVRSVRALLSSWLNDTSSAGPPSSL